MNYSKLFHKIVVMETMIIGIKDQKAKQLLTDLAALDLIEIKSDNTVFPDVKLADLKK